MHRARAQAERRAFLNGTIRHRDDFYAISKEIVTRTRAEVVAHFYTTSRLKGLGKCLGGGAGGNATATQRQRGDGMAAGCQPICCCSVVVTS